MKKMYDDSLVRKLFEKWGVVINLKCDRGKYGSQDDEDYVSNDILGIVKVKKIKELENKGAIIFSEGTWKIHVEPIFITSENKNNFHAGRCVGEIVYIPSRAWINYCENKNT